MATLVDELVATLSAVKRPDIQGLRAIAVLVVLIHHAELPLSGGFIGVDMFFVISGFVITESIFRRLDAGGSFSVREFLGRRFARLFPPLGVVVAVTCVTSIFVVPIFGEQTQVAQTAVGSLLGLSNLVIALTTGGYFDVPALANPLLHLWSLGVEEQFYLGFSVLVAALIRLRGDVRVHKRLLALNCLGIVATASLTFVVAHGDFSAPIPPWTVGFFSPVLRAWEIQIGVVLALILRDRSERLSKVAMSQLSLGLLGVLAFSLMTISEQTSYPSIWTLLPVGTTALVILAGSFEATLTSRMLGSKPLTLIGNASYSLYLWHWPFVSFGHLLFPSSRLAPVVATVISVLPAYLSYRYLELPNQSHNDRKSWSLMKMVTLSTVIPSVAAYVLFFGAARSWLLDWPVTSSKSDKAVIARGCIDKAFIESQCTWAPGGVTRPWSVLLVGDSHAYSVADGVIAATNALGGRVIVGAVSACPFSIFVSTGDHAMPCHDWQRSMTKLALRSDISVVVIANRSAGYTRPSIGWRVLRDPDGVPANADNAVQLYEFGMTKMINHLIAGGKSVVLVNSLAEPFSVERRDSLLRRWVSLPAYSFDLKKADEARSPSRELETRIAKSMNVVVVDPMRSLCKNDYCPYWDGIGDLYLDPIHLSRHGSELLTNDFLAAIKTAVSN